MKVSMTCHETSNLKVIDLADDLILSEDHDMCYEQISEIFNLGMSNSKNLNKKNPITIWMHHDKFGGKNLSQMLQKGEKLIIRHFTQPQALTWEVKKI